MNYQFSMARLALTTALGVVLLSGAAYAKPERIDAGKVQALAARIEGALDKLGERASVQDDMAAIEAVIGTSGENPEEVLAALHVVQTTARLSRDQHVAVASVDQTLASETALTPGAGGGPGGAAAIGSPPSYVGGGGSNYVAP